MREVRFDPEKLQRHQNRMERKHSRQARRMAGWVVRLAERDKFEVELPTFNPFLGWTGLKQIIGGPGFDDEVFDKVNELLAGDGISVSHEYQGGVDIGHQQYMTLHHTTRLVMPD